MKGQTPPLQYMQDCTVPVIASAPTNGDLVVYAKDLKFSLLLCNTDKAALRMWADLTK